MPQDSVVEWLDTSVRPGFGAKFAGAFAGLVGVHSADDLAWLEADEMQYLETCLATAGAGTQEQQLIWVGIAALAKAALGSPLHRQGRPPRKSGRDSAKRAYLSNALAQPALAKAPVSQQSEAVFKTPARQKHGRAGERHGTGDDDVSPDQKASFAAFRQPAFGGDGSGGAGGHGAACMGAAFAAAAADCPAPTQRPALPSFPGPSLAMPPPQQQTAAAQSPAALIAGTPRSRAWLAGMGVSVFAVCSDAGEGGAGNMAALLASELPVRSTKHNPQRMLYVKHGTRGS
jgi:hypothetical protein